MNEDIPLIHRSSVYTYGPLSKVSKFLLIAISGFFLGYSKALTAADEQRLDLCVCPL